MKNADGCPFIFMEKEKNCVTVHGYEQLQICNCSGRSAHLAGSCNRSAPLAELLRKFAQKCSEKLCLKKMEILYIVFGRKLRKKWGRIFGNPAKWLKLSLK